MKQNKKKERPEYFVFHTRVTNDPNIKREASRIVVEFEYHLRRFFEMTQPDK